MAARRRRLLDLPLPWVFAAFIAALGLMFLIDSALSQGSSSPMWIGRLAPADAEQLAACRTSLADRESQVAELAGEMAKLNLSLLELRQLCVTKVCDAKDFAPAELVGKSRQ